MTKTGIGVLASGRGSNFEALAKACGRGDIAGEIRVLVANVPGAPVLKRAESFGIPAKLVNHKEFATRAAFEQVLVAELASRGVGLVCLAGFMRILSPYFVGQFENRIMNIHPSLLPAFAGLQGRQVHEAVVASGAKFSGCTVHFVTNELDAGPTILQRVVAVEDSDTPENLALRVLVEEHQAYVEAVKLFCANRLEVAGRRVRVRPER